MTAELKVKVSRYMSYLLRHNPEDLKIDEKGFVSFKDLLPKIQERYNVDERFIINEVVKREDRKRFEIVGGKVRALYGHSIEVKVGLEEDKSVIVLYHGTTAESASQILKEGLRPMKRKWVHLSPTREMAIQVGQRRTSKPVVLEISAEDARKNGLKFFRPTENVYLCRKVSSKYITPSGQEERKPR